MHVREDHDIASSTHELDGASSFPNQGSAPVQGPAKKSPPPFCSELVGPVRNAIVRARHFLIAQQRSDGAWIGRQTGDALLPSQLIFLLTYLGRENTELAEQCAATILNEQRPDGGWSFVPDGSAEISTSVQAYFALKLTGHDPSDERLGRARNRIRELGGADVVDDTTRFFLALLGQLSYDHCQVMPPEMLLFRATETSQQTPFSIVWSQRPVRQIEIERGVRELFINKPSDWRTPGAVERIGRLRRQSNSLFRIVCEFTEWRGWTPLRRRALNRAESQLLAQIDPTRISELDFQELVWHIIALQTIGYPADGPELCACEETLHGRVDVDDETGFAFPRLQAESLPDSSLVLRSLGGSGLSLGHPAIADGISVTCRTTVAEAPLATFGLCNVLEGLHRSEQIESAGDSGLPPEIDIRRDWQYAANVSEQMAQDQHETISHAVASCIKRLRDNQNPDGGWSTMAGTGHQNQQSEPAATGAVLEALAGNASAELESALNRAANYLRLRQRADGSWVDFNSVQHVWSTSSAIRGLLAAGVSANDDVIASAVNWLIIQQQPGGAWTASPMQTAWAILALVAADKTDHPAVRRGIDHLLRAQDDEGGWDERQLALQDPVSVRWLKNDLRGIAWALLALSRWAVAASSAQPAAADKASLRLVAAGAEI